MELIFRLVGLGDLAAKGASARSDAASDNCDVFMPLMPLMQTYHNLVFKSIIEI